MADPPVFFVSYARQDAYYPEDRETLLEFVKKLEARVAAMMGVPPEGVSKMDEHIKAGEIWSEALRDSLMPRCRHDLYSSRISAIRIRDAEHARGARDPCRHPRRPSCRAGGA